MLDLKKTVLLLTDFSYEAKGREYFREDVILSTYLRKYFRVWISHIEDCEALLDQADAVLIRNTGPQNTHRAYLNALKKRTGLLTGKGDILGKAHLLELYQAGYPVIPTFRSPSEVLDADRYLLKPIDGADSNGVEIVDRDALALKMRPGLLIQPLVDFAYEVSFYFIGEDFHYALYAPDPDKRWELKLYAASDSEIAFALQFIRWNSARQGIQRVDACRLKNGALLLMELEDYNPFLSLEVLPKKVKESFLEALCASIKNRFDLTPC